MSDIRLTELRVALVRLQRRACDYCSTIDGAEVSGFCDCKYGGPRSIAPDGSEQTGCPELREVSALFNAMTDAEFSRLWKRAEKRAKQARRAVVRRSELDRRGKR